MDPKTPPAELAVVSEKNTEILPVSPPPRAVKAQRFAPTDEQERFFRHMIIDGMNPVAAAQASGIKDGASYAYKLAKHPRFDALKAELKRKVENASLMTRKRVIDGFLEAIEIGKVKSDGLVMVAGWREIARMCGYYEPTKHQLEVTVNGTVTLERLQTMSDAQLLALAEGKTIEGEVVSRELPGPG